MQTEIVRKDCGAERRKNSAAVRRRQEASKTAEAECEAPDKTGRKPAVTTPAQTQKPAETTKKPAATTPATTTKPAETTQAPETGAYSVSAEEREVVRLVNEIRRSNGLSELTLNEELSRVARIKSEDMAKNNYFSHNSPTYGSPFDMMKRFGISYRAAGENIARDSGALRGWLTHG